MFGAQGFVDNNMFISPTQNAHVGCLDQHETPTRIGSHSSGI